MDGAASASMSAAAAEAVKVPLERHQLAWQELPPAWGAGDAVRHQPLVRGCMEWGAAG
jgi:hypothetical protein